MSLPRALLLSALSAILVPAAAGAQATPVDPRPDTLSGVEAEPLMPGDSAALVRSARAAQARFERRRVRHFPMVWAAGSGGTCDEVIGRMCIRFGPGSDWEPEPEADEVLDERGELLETLAEIADQIPGDDWVLGQRIHYLGEAGRWDEAEALARECGAASPWWCSALRGHALHHLDRFPEAALAFDTALASMDPEQALEWRDLEWILDRDGYRTYGSLEEDARHALEDRVWALANPLLLVSGNDHRTVHFSRRVASAIRARARNPHNIGWGSDLAEITVRYGSVYGWERERPRWSDLGPPRVLGRFHPKSRGLLPPGRYLADPTGLLPGEWTTDERRARSRYAPSYAPRIHGLDPQVALLTREDSVLVIAAWEAEGSLSHPRADWEPAPEGPYRSGLFLIPVLAEGGAEESETGSGTTPRPGVLPSERPWTAGGIREGDGVPGSRAETGRSGILQLTAPAGDYVLSLETWHSEERLAWRAREGVRHEPLPRGVIALSDLLVLRPAGEPAEPGSEHPDPELDELVARLLPRAEVPSGGIVEVAWEVYGLEPQDAMLSFRVTVGRGEPGALRRAAQWLRIVEPEAPVEVAWSEPGPGRGGPFLRTVNLDLSSLDPGDYRLRLELEPAGRTPVRTERTLRIPDRGS